MKLRYLAILSLVVMLLAVTGCKAQTPGNQPGLQEPQTEVKLSEYFPMVKDVHKKYKGTGNEFAEYETYIDYTKDNLIQIRNINPGTTTVSVYEVTDDVVRRVFSHGEIYYRYDYTAARNSDEIILKAPLKVGNSWQLADGSTRTITAIDKEITTPAGSYKALEVTTENADSTVTDYYVKDIGHVKQEFKSKEDGYTVTSELEVLKNDVPYVQTIRLYFPDFPKDRIVYVDREVEIRTNEDMRWKFQKELKTIPNDSVLTKVLTTNTQMSSPVVDEEKGIVTVDFTNDLIEEMNAGASLEAMIVNSIVNTIGGYYQKDKVIITIDGKPYASGHIEMKPGEYFSTSFDKTVKYGE